MLFVFVGAACGSDTTGGADDPECAGNLRYNPISGECEEGPDDPSNHGVRGEPDASPGHSSDDVGASEPDLGGDEPDMGMGSEDVGGGSGDTGVDPDPGCVDADGDGACADVDCDDADPRRSPEFAELCDEVDNDCDDELNEGLDCSIYAHSSTNVYRIDFFEGTFEDLGPGPNGLELYDIDTAPDGTLYGIAGDHLYWYDAVGQTWTQAPQSLSSLFEGANGFCIDNDGTAYATAAFTLRVVNLQTGSSSSVGSMFPASSSGDCVVNKGNVLYMSSNHTTPDSFVRLDGGTAQSTVVGQTGYDGIWGLTAAWNRLFGLTDAGEVVEIDPTTGATTLIHHYPGLSFFGAASTPAR